MKRIAVSMIAVGAVLFAGGSGASAQEDGGATTVPTVYNTSTTVAPTSTTTTVAGATTTTAAPTTTVAPPTVTVSNLAPAPGSSFTVTVRNCPASSATFSFQGSTQTVNTTSGAAAATFTAPATAGTFTGTTTCGTSVSSFSVTVPAIAPTPTNPPAGLPATGNSGSGSTMVIASMLLLAGVGMFGVAQVRRRQVIA